VCAGGCGGVWFDAFELLAVDEPGEAVGDLLDIPYDRDVKAHGGRRDCPHCPGTVMMQHWFSVAREVQVDECPRCGGFFLDRGELAAIREQFPDEEARRQAARQHFADLFDDRLEAQADASGQNADRARRFAHVLRFVLPSWWLKGKQPWGAY
jgi:Zn-finger nucleic acid-binding protein